MQYSVAANRTSENDYWQLKYSMLNRFILTKNTQDEFMLGYLLIAISLSALAGAIFFLILGQPSGAGVAILTALIVGGVFWQMKQKK